MEEILKNNWTTAVLGLTGDAEVHVVPTGGLVDVVVAVITDHVTLIQMIYRGTLEGNLTCGVSLA